MMKPSIVGFMRRGRIEAFEFGLGFWEAAMWGNRSLMEWAMFNVPGCDGLIGYFWDGAGI